MEMIPSADPWGWQRSHLSVSQFFPSTLLSRGGVAAIPAGFARLQEPGVLNAGIPGRNFTQRCGNGGMGTGLGRAAPGEELASGSCQAAELLPEEQRLPHRSALPCDCEMNVLNIGQAKTASPK